jgi:hypothetical protein
MKECVFGILFLILICFAGTVVLSPFVASYLWVAGIVPWWVFALTVCPAIITAAFLWLIWSMRNFDIGF